MKAALAALRWGVSVFLIFVLIGGACPALAKQQTPSAAQSGNTAKPPVRLSLELQPAELVLDQSGKLFGRMLLVVHNPDQIAINAADLHFTAPAGLNVTVAGPPDPPHSGDFAWTLEVSANELSPATAKLVAELAHGTGRHGEPVTIAIASATVTQSPPLDLASLVKSSLVPTDGLIDRFTPLDLQLQLQNTGRRTVVVDNIRLLSPTYAMLTAPSGRRIEPGSTILMPLKARTADAVVPGAYPLVIAYTIGVPGRSDLHADATAQAKLTIGVPGLSEAMQFLGIPSLLLLPGALTVLAVVATISLLTRTQPIDWKNPALLVLAISLSFAYAYFYPFAVQFFSGQRRDYLRGYDLTDVVYLWAGSIGIGLGLAVLAAAAYWLWIIIRAELRRRHLPSETDSAYDILRKMSLHGVDFRMTALRRRPANAEAAAVGPRFLALPFGEVAAEQRWVVRQALLRPTDRPGAEERVQQILAVTAIDANHPANIRRLWRGVQAGRRHQQVTLVWPEDNLAGPRRITDADYVGLGERDLFLRRGDE